jgi:serine/threonine protein kinase
MEKSMKGGKLIGQGGYGCVFDPPLVCRGDKAPKKGYRKGKLGKLTAPEDIANELFAAETFGHKPESKKYFILPEIDTLCTEGPRGEPSINISAQHERDIDRCGFITNTDISELLHYQMDYGGKTLQDKLMNIEVAVKEFSYVQFVRNMLEIGAYLLLNGMIHNDLHGANIMMNKDYHPRLIDFGRGYAANAITEETLEHLAAEYEHTPNEGPALGQISPECSIQDGLGEGREFKTMIQDLIRAKPGLLYAERLFGQGREEQMAEFQKFWATSKAVQQKDYLTFWKLYWPVVDAWSIGHVLASVLTKLSRSDTFMKSKQLKQKFPLIKAVITGLLRASPRDRLDCLEALALYDPKHAFVSSASGKAWLEKRKAQRERMRLPPKSA